MSLNAHQFRNLVVHTLDEVDMGGDSAVALLLGTAAQESRFGTYLKQLGGGPALGFFQCEKSTFRWLRSKYPKWLVGRAYKELEWDIKLGILVCRLRYKVIPEPLPPANDLPALAAYWKKYYNTPHGKGKPEEFIKNFQNYVL